MTKALKTSPEGRKCEYAGCHQILSIYNHQEYCRVHQEKISSEQKPEPYRHTFK